MKTTLNDKMQSIASTSTHEQASRKIYGLVKAGDINRNEFIRLINYLMSTR